MNYFGRSLTINPVKLSASLLVLTSMALALVVVAMAGSPAPVQGRKSAAKEVVSKLVAGDVEGVRADFNEQMKQGLSADQMRQVWAEAIKYHGKFVSQREANNAQQQGHDVYSIRCEMEKSPMEVVVAYDGNGKIGGLWLRPAKA